MQDRQEKGHPSRTSVPEPEYPDDITLDVLSPESAKGKHQSSEEQPLLM